MKSNVLERTAEQEPVLPTGQEVIELAPEAAGSKSLLEIKHEQPTREEVEVRMGILCRQVQLLRSKYDEELTRMQQVESASNSSRLSGRKDCRQDEAYQQASQNNALNCARLAKAQARYSRTEIKLLFPM